MQIELPAEQVAFLEQLVATGRYSSPDDAVRDGVRLLISKERLREEVQLGIQQADRGELVDHDTVFTSLRAIAAAAEDAP